MIAILTGVGVLVVTAVVAGACWREAYYWWRPEARLWGSWQKLSDIGSRKSRVWRFDRGTVTYYEDQEPEKRLLYDVPRAGRLLLRDAEGKRETHQYRFELRPDGDDEILVIEGLGTRKGEVVEFRRYPDSP